MLQKAIDFDNRVTIWDVIEQVYLNNFQMLLVVDEKIEAVCITSIVQHPTMKVMVVNYLSGENMADWKHLLPIFDQWAREIGCEEIEIQGRKGWLKTLPDFNLKSVIMVKKLWDHQKY